MLRTLSLPAPVTKPGTIEVLGRHYPTDSYTNITPAILSRLNARLIDKPAHPLATLKALIEDYFADYALFSSFPPLVTPKQNFDDLSFAPDHPGRAVTDSYYVNKDLMLRTHTSAHEVEIFAAGHKKWLLTADVFRRDEIDASHYPIFHQMEGARLFKHDRTATSASLIEENERLSSELSYENVQLEDKTRVDSGNPYQSYHDPQLADLVTQNLKYTLSLMFFKLFAGVAGASKSNPLQIRWIPAFFPFTSPSYEVEVLFRDKWLELLGCGVIQQATLANSKIENEIGWAFGLGLERIAMILYQIPDIRLFWSEDPRFLGQFQPGKITTFKPFSKYPGTWRDVSFWLPERFHSNDFCDIVRVVAGDLAEEVTLFDQFKHPMTGKESMCFRITFRSMERNLENTEVNVLTNIIKDRATKELGVEIR
ncbi:phenylalanyl-tRNA synthetase [Fomitiporia mediterranea MF3/22]|uniref:phenylalanyl-tRNA synthetase n=1 Tax=Fomitiporia mediterranea (strain MF3/22) TaxID=694068 RepID=UPI00044094E9|nr:phenylalanyl-tRNA synthetase [Fomitiporia mediterranea MF3/22]EJD06054.1 phenylalanyl-tRNA synthetase [Fomitiporia mediterranea MF3/22]